MRKIIAIILTVCLLTVSILLIFTEKSSSSGMPIADAGEDQIVYEGEVVQFNGSDSTEALNVLHVSVWQYNDLQLIIDYTGSEDKFSVTQIGLSEFNAGTPSDLSSYDAIVFGISNAFEWTFEPIGRTSELKGYVSTGGGIVWTHDTLEHLWDYGADLEGPAGVDYDSNLTLFGLNIPNVEIIMDHEILHNLFDIGNTGDIIPKTPQPPPWFNYAHTSRGNVTTAEVIIQHSTTSGSENFYLTTHEFGEGRVVVDEIGHAYIGEYGDFWGLPSLKECQILVNAVYWVADGGNVSSLLTYSWDFDANLDSDSDGNLTNDIDATGPTPTHVYGDDGIYTVTVTVTDVYGLSGNDTCNITVSNLAPTIAPFGPFIIDEDTPLLIAATATDPGSDDLTFTWIWGDGSSNTVTTYYNDGIGPDPYPSPWGVFPFSEIDTVQHMYGESGIYTINLTVEDDDGGITIYLTNVTVIGIAPPKLYIDVSSDGKDVEIYWDPPLTLGIDHYLIYRTTSQVVFDFNTIWRNTSCEMEPGESAPIPLRTMWNDTNAAFPANDTNYKEQYYYVIRAVNIFGRVSSTSRTVGKWTKTFPKGISTFSLPLEPIDILDTDNLTTSMNAKYIKDIDPDAHIWRKHDFGYGTTNNTQMKLGEGYEVELNSQTNYTFTGMPGAMISYDDDNGFLGFDHATEAKNLTVIVEPNGDVNLSWQEPGSMRAGDWYEVYYSIERDGFFKTPGIDYSSICPPVYFGNNTATHEGAKANDPSARLYYMVVPFNASGVRGASTYSIGIWTEGFLSQYDTFGIPLKLSINQTADWYCDNINNTVGINYFDSSAQRWCWHSARMPRGAYDPMLVMTNGYQISTSSATKFTFMGA